MPTLMNVTIEGGCYFCGRKYEVDPNYPCNACPACAGKAFLGIDPRLYDDNPAASFKDDDK